MAHLQRLAGGQDSALLVAQAYTPLRQAPLRVGLLPAIGPACIGRFLGGFRDQPPGVERAVSEGSVAMLAKRLDSADLDVAVTNAAGGFGDQFRTEKR